jgi:uncharacterized cupredoxin-like copper-binding protein
VFKLSLGLGLLLATVLLTAAACGGDDDSTAPEDGGDVREIAIKMTDQVRFEPSEITVAAGERVRLMVENVDGNGVHDFAVEQIAVENVMSEGDEGASMGEHDMDQMDDMAGGFDLHVAMDGGESGEIEFTPTSAGQYEFYCTVAGHRELGMAGTLIVTA